MDEQDAQDVYGAKGPFVQVAEKLLSHMRWLSDKVETPSGDLELQVKYFEVIVKDFKQASEELANLCNVGRRTLEKNQAEFDKEKAEFLKEKANFEGRKQEFRILQDKAEKPTGQLRDIDLEAEPGFVGVNTRAADLRNIVTAGFDQMKTAIEQSGVETHRQALDLQRQLHESEIARCLEEHGYQLQRSETLLEFRNALEVRQLKDKAAKETRELKDKLKDQKRMFEQERQKCNDLRDQLHTKDLDYERRSYARLGADYDVSQARDRQADDEVN
ncbi:hypothetical protein F5Y18DRAFT_431207 [Xylariaceae sp. FL1019]|nr:hypothetical protein F5Y18DRAFT_431207 [Xylariaceae sp. FL1019]